MIRARLSPYAKLLVDLFLLVPWCTALCSCTSDEEPLIDARLMTHEQLMNGSDLIEPDNANGIRIAVLSGQPYQMGYQHGVMLANELAEFREAVDDDLIWRIFLDLATEVGPDDSMTYIEYAIENSLPSVVDECEGIVEGSEHAFEMEHCILLASITYIIEDLVPRHFPGIRDILGCSGVIAMDDATTDGRMLHARNLDYLAVETIMENPMLFVRRPIEGHRHVNVGWPGQAAILTGMNEHGLTGEINENYCPSESFRDMTGVPPQQQMVDILTRARDLDEAEAIVAETDQASCQLYVISHAPSRSGTVFEVWGLDYRTRTLDETDTGDVLFATNHFEHPESGEAQEPRDIVDLFDNSVSRYYRLSERLLGSSLPPHTDLDPSAPDFAYGRLDVETGIDVLRDPVDLRPDQDRRMFPCSEYQDGNWALGNNHNIHSVIMIGETLEIWMAAGWDDECTNPIYNPFVGFDLSSLFAGAYDAAVLSSVDPPFNDAYGTAIHVE